MVIFDIEDIIVVIMHKCSESVLDTSTKFD